MATPISILLDVLADKIGLVLEKERESLSIGAIDNLEHALDKVEEVRLAARTASTMEVALRTVDLVMTLLRALGFASM